MIFRQNWKWVISWWNFWFWYSRRRITLRLTSFETINVDLFFPLQHIDSEISINMNCRKIYVLDDLYFRKEKHICLPIFLLLADDSFNLKVLNSTLLCLYSVIHEIHWFFQIVIINLSLTKFWRIRPHIFSIYINIHFSSRINS